MTYTSSFVPAHRESHELRRRLGTTDGVDGAAEAGAVEHQQADDHDDDGDHDARRDDQVVHLLAVDQLVLMGDLLDRRVRVEAFGNGAQRRRQTAGEEHHGQAWR